MRHVVAGTQRIGDGVAAGGVDRPEAIAAIERGECHAGAASGSFPVGRLGQPATGEPDPLEGVEVDERMCLLVGEGLDAVGERIDTRRHGDRLGMPSARSGSTTARSASM
jgi:hypothetical protein